MLHGKYTNYNRGAKSSEHYYKNDEPHGPFYSYFVDGTIQAKGLYLNGAQVGNVVYFNSKGQEIYIEKYENGKIIEIEHLKPDGGIDCVVDYKKEGPQTLKFSRKMEVHSYQTLNGNLNGKYLSIDANHDTIYLGSVLNDEIHGKMVFFKPTGMRSFECDAKHGNYHGKARYYDDLGNLHVTSEYKNGEENGQETYYYANGKKRTEFINYNDVIHGERLIFNMQGDTLARLDYYNGLIQSYWLIGQEEFIQLDTARQVIKGMYPNGNMAFELSLHRKYFDGNVEIYEENGNASYKSTYKNGSAHGQRIYYHVNGQIYRLSHFEFGFSEGETNYFDQNGAPVLKFNYNNNNLNGEYLIYKNSELILTKVYNDDELIEIK